MPRTSTSTSPKSSTSAAQGSTQLWSMLLVGGLDEDGTPFLSFADLLGTTYNAPTLATGFGAHLAQPLLRRLVPEDEKSVKDITRQQAVEAVYEGVVLQRCEEFLPFPTCT